ncbi:MAG: hypothetical protein R2690_19705 [Acidimicrobiales bacterium]
MTADLDADVRRAAATPSDAEPTSDDLWVDASQLGLGHPALAHRQGPVRPGQRGADGRRLRDGLRARRRLPPPVGRRRTLPADDAHDRWRTDGTLFPRRSRPCRWTRSSPRSPAREPAAGPKSVGAPLDQPAPVTAGDIVAVLETAAPGRWPSATSTPRPTSAPSTRR